MLPWPKQSPSGQALRRPLPCVTPSHGWRNGRRHGQTCPTARWLTIQRYGWLDASPVKKPPDQGRKVNARVLPYTTTEIQGPAMRAQRQSFVLQRRPLLKCPQIVARQAFVAPSAWRSGSLTRYRRFGSGQPPHGTPLPMIPSVSLEDAKLNK